MGDIENGQRKMREYWRRQRERQNQPIKANIPPPQENVAQTVSQPQQPIVIRPQPQIIIQEHQPFYQPPPPNYQQRPTQYNFPALGFTLLLIAGIFAYLVYTTPNMMQEVTPFLLTIPETIRLLCFGAFVLSCLALIFAGRKK